MIGSWQKLGLLYDPSAETDRSPALLTHAANPLAVHMDGDVFRVFYSGRDAKQRSSVGGVDIDIVQRTVVADHREPFFAAGPPDSFYADGVSIGNCYEAGGKRYILFMGWQTPADQHWYGEMGRLVLTDEGTLDLDGTGPFMKRDEIDPISVSYPWVMGSDDAGYEMWYGSTRTWDGGNGEMVHVINHATSENGQVWTKFGQAVPAPLGTAQAFSSPTVVSGPGRSLEMWFSYRGAPPRTYRIGHATSPDGFEWSLDLDGNTVDVSDSGWDSEMVEYPYVFEHAGSRYMLYCGNGYGRSGFGLARWREET